MPSAFNLLPLIYTADQLGYPLVVLELISDAVDWQKNGLNFYVVVGQNQWDPISG